MANLTAQSIAHINSQIDYYLSLELDFASETQIWSDASSWYPTCRLWIQHHIPAHVPMSDIKYYVATFAILSQNKDVRDNKKLFLRVVQEPLSGGTTSDEVKKANLCLHNIPFVSITKKDVTYNWNRLSAVKGLKIQAFYDNLMYLSNSQVACIDTHMAKALLPEDVPLANHHVEISDQLVLKAKELRIPVTTLQAYIWIKRRSVQKKCYLPGNELFQLN
jgi:hypothetical protein